MVGRFLYILIPVRSGYVNKLVFHNYADTKYYKPIKLPGPLYAFVWVLNWVLEGVERVLHKVLDLFIPSNKSDIWIFEAQQANSFNTQINIWYTRLPNIGIDSTVGILMWSFGRQKMAFPSYGCIRPPRWHNTWQYNFAYDHQHVYPHLKNLGYTTPDHNEFELNARIGQHTHKMKPHLSVTIIVLHKNYLES